MKPHPEVEFAAFAGIDWSDTKHDICLQAANSEEREFSILLHRPAAIDAKAHEALVAENVSLRAQLASAGDGARVRARRRRAAV